MGVTGVYLIYLTTTIFFVLMAMLTANLRHSHQFRAKIHNGFWFWKFLFIIVLFAGLFVGIVYTGLADPFLNAFQWIALVFGSMFIFWKMTLFINFAYDWGKTWAQAAKRSNTKSGKNNLRKNNLTSPNY